MKKFTQTYTFFLIFVSYTLCEGQHKTHLPAGDFKFNTEAVITSLGPHTIFRDIEQDRNGNVWLASFDGIFRYDGKSFTNITSEVTSAHFFSVLEDRKGNLWFGSRSGVYYYDGKSFKNFTTKEGLVNNTIICIYEDKLGNIWFGAHGGASRYDGKSFRNYIIKGDSLLEDRTGITFSNSERPEKAVGSILQDKTGKLWFGTRGNAFVYDGKSFTTLTHNGKSFRNVNSIIEDEEGNIWLGSQVGLWRYDGRVFTNFTQQHPVPVVYEDRSGNIWTGSRPRDWVVSRYDEKSLSNNIPIATEFVTEYADNMVFKILEAHDASIWVGTLRGAYRIDGNVIRKLKDQECQ